MQPFQNIELVKDWVKSQRFEINVEILSEFNFYVRVRTYEKRVTGMQP
jgi:hypothetical protein